MAASASPVKAEGAPPAKFIEPKDYAKVLALTKSVAEDAKRLQSQLSAMRVERDEAQTARDSLAREAQSLRESNGLLTRDMAALKSQLSEEQASRSALAGELAALRTQLAASQAEVQGAFWNGRPQVQAELESAWESLVGPRLERLQKALTAATGIGVDPAVKSSNLAGRQRKQGSESIKNGKVDSRDTKDKKRKQEEQANKDKGKLRRTGTPVDLNVGRTASSAACTIESDESSGDSLAANSAGQRAGGRLLAHRTLRPGPSGLKKKRPHSRAQKGARLSFVSEHTLAIETVITSFRHCGEKLWVTNPEANVMCEVCMKRFPQQGGRLSGGTGFMSHRSFHCHACSSVIEEDGSDE